MSVDHQEPPSRASKREDRPSAEVFRRRRIVVGAAAGVLVLVVVALTAFVWPGYALPEPLPTPTHTVTAPAPTPSISPAPRAADQTALVKALPDAVRQFAQQAIADYHPWQDEHQATEAWTVTYADAVGAGAKTITVEVGQWVDAATATTFADGQITASGPAAKTGDVTVDGKMTGNYALFPSGDKAVMWWRNGTVVIRAEGPADQIEAFYTEFPL